jgi:hypothetical protein
MKIVFPLTEARKITSRYFHPQTDVQFYTGLLDLDIAAALEIRDKKLAAYRQAFAVFWEGDMGVGGEAKNLLLRLVDAYTRDYLERIKNDAAIR